MKRIRVEYVGWGSAQEALLGIARMRRGGMEIERDELSFDEWEWLGIAEEERHRAELRLMLRGMGNILE